MGSLMKSAIGLHFWTVKYSMHAEAKWNKTAQSNFGTARITRDIFFHRVEFNVTPAGRQQHSGHDAGIDQWMISLLDNCTCHSTVRYWEEKLKNSFAICSFTEGIWILDPSSLECGSLGPKRRNWHLGSAGFTVVTNKQTVHAISRCL